MSKIGEIVAINVPVSRKTRLKIEGDYSHNDVIITMFPKTVSVLNLQSQQITKEWSLKGNRKLSSPAIASSSTNIFTAIVDNQTIRNWHEDDVEIDTTKKITLPKIAHQVLQGESNIYVLYKDGTCSNVGKGQDRMEIGKPIVGVDAEISWSQIYFNLNYEYIVFVVRKKSEKNFTVCAYRIGSNADNSLFYQCNISSVDSDASCLSHCVYCYDDKVYFIMLWSSGALSRINIIDNSGSNDVYSHIPNINCSLASIHAIDQSQLLVCGVVSKEEYGKPERVGIGIWVTDFNILQGFKSLPCEHYTKLQMYCFEQKIIIQTENGLYVAPYESKKSNLRAMLGKFGATEETLSDLKQKVIALVEDHEDDSAMMSTSCVPNLLEKWAEDSKKDSNFRLPCDLLKKLLRKHYIRANDLKKLMPLLTRSSSVELIFECLTTVNNVAESTVTHCLAYFLSCENNKLVEAVESLQLSKLLQEEEGCSGVDKHRAIFINLLLSMTYNDIFMLECLQYLPFQHVLILICYLYDLLCVTTGGLITPKIGQMMPPNLLQVVEWISVLFDAHFTQIILSEEARTLLVRLHEIVQEKIDFFGELNRLDAILTRLQERRDLPNSSKKDVGSYCIEILHF